MSLPWWVQFLREIFLGAMTKEELHRNLNGSVVGDAALTMALDSTLYSADAEEASKRAGIVQFCRMQLGDKYKLGVEVSKSGESTEWDCSELVELAYLQYDMDMPDGSNFQYDHCQPVPSGKQGDLHFLWSDKWNRIGHVMVDTGAGTVIHAKGGVGVVEENLSDYLAHPRYRGCRRHPDFARAKNERA